MSLNLFIIGPSGCGKSTQAKLIADKYNLTHLSMGQLLRDEMEAATDLGVKAQDYVNRGVWAPDDLVMDILTPHLVRLNYQNFIVDGFPRVLNQGKVIEYYLQKQGQPFSLLIHLNVTFEEILARRTKMGAEFQDKSRTDNTPEAVAARQKSYEDTVGPIKDYFRSVGKLLEVDGNRPIDPIFVDICLAINHHWEELATKQSQFTLSQSKGHSERSEVSPPLRHSEEQSDEESPQLSHSDPATTREESHD